MTVPIDLAAEADFVLGALNVRPSLREVANGASTETLEPRVMQVLVALARRPGQVVSRDQLVTLCWEGRAVGEDAIQRAIAKVRKLGEATTAFSIDTVARVGYRLKSDSAPQAKPSVNATTPEPVLAVLPFDNLSDDREMQFFSDGVSEEVLHAIARARGIKVIGRMSTFQFRGERKPDAALSLNARYILDGSVRRAGNRVRINAHLVDHLTGTSLYSDQFDHDLSDTLKVQTEIAGAIAKKLRLQFDKSSPEPLSATAYDLWLQARSLKLKDLSARSAPGVAALLEKAIALAPRFAAGWAALATAKAMMLPGLKDSLGSVEHTAAMTAATNALRIDPRNVDALQALAYLKPAFAAHQEKLDLFHQSLDLAPNDAFAAFGYAGALMAVGRIIDALPYTKASFELEPQADTPHFLALHAIALCSSGAIDEGISLIDDVRRTTRDSYAIWYLWIWLNGARGDAAEGLALLDKNPPPQAELHIAETTLLRHLIATLLQPQSVRANTMRTVLNPASPSLWIGACKMAAEAGCADEAYDAFETAFRTGQPLAAPGAAVIGFPRALQAGGLFMFDAKALRADPRFARVCAHLNLVDYWMTSGHWPDCADEVPYDFRAECEKALAALR